MNNQTPFPFRLPISHVFKRPKSKAIQPLPFSSVLATASSLRPLTKAVQEASILFQGCTSTRRDPASGIRPVVDVQLLKPAAFQDRSGRGLSSHCNIYKVLFEVLVEVEVVPVDLEVLAPLPVRTRATGFPGRAGILRGGILSSSSMMYFGMGAIRRLWVSISSRSYKTAAPLLARAPCNPGR